jgi:AraC-like DNA-binding protein
MSKPKLCLKSYQPITNTHQHDFHQLVLPVKGHLDIQVEHLSGRVGQKHAAVICASNDHAFESHDDNQFIVADIPLSLAPAFDKLPVFIQLDNSLNNYIQFLQTQLNSAAKQNSPHQKSIPSNNSLLERQMLVLLIQLLDEKHADNPLIDRRIELARQYLEVHFSEKNCLTDAANYCAISPRHMRQLFSQYYHVSPSQFLLELRMQCAWQLLTSTQRPLDWIAQHCGYSTLSAFSDRFQKHFSNTPNQVRRLSK